MLYSIMESIYLFFLTLTEYPSSVNSISSWDANNLNTRWIQLIVHIGKLLWMRKSFCRYHINVKLMATIPSAGNICTHLEISPKIWDFVFGGNEIGSVQWKIYFFFFFPLRTEQIHGML